MTTNRIPVYTSAAPPAPSSDELRARIPGWGVDLDPADRPSYPREQHLESGAHWDFPDRQPGGESRERSVEHQMLPPVFGTTVPLRGLSGRLRRYSYDRFSEARAAHWLLLLAADRVDAVESHLASFATLRPDNPVTETGMGGELRKGWTRFRGHRVDLKHQWIDPVVVAGPWVAAAAVGIAVGGTVLRKLRR